MKLINLNASVNNGENKITCHSDIDCSLVRSGSFLKFNNDDVFYIIARNNKDFYVYNFEVLSPKQLKVKGDLTRVLFQLDSVNIVYKEYELSSLLSIKQKGSGFKVDQEIIIDGILSKNIVDESTEPLKFRVSEVNKDGGIENVEIVSKGKYLVPPSKLLEISDAILEVEYQPTETRKKFEREIDKIVKTENFSIVYLTYPLFEGIKDGELSCEKWSLFLSSNYAGNNKNNETCCILRDFTPNIGLPLLAKNSFSPESIVNLAWVIVDQKISDTDKKVVELQNEIKNLKELINKV